VSHKSAGIDRNRRGMVISTTAGLGALFCGGLTRIIPNTITIKHDKSDVLRPPGSLHEESFLSVCNRCEQCVDVCPTKVIVAAGLDTGLTGIGTPRFNPGKNHCTLCGACDRVCPTGALTTVPKKKMRMGTALLDKQKCFGWPGGGLCYLDICPFNAVHFDDLHRPSIIESNCTGCGMCVGACPALAIIIIRQGEIRRAG
jgi:ferredoxin-type protein NapF